MPNRCLPNDNAIGFLGAAFTNGVSTEFRIAAGPEDRFGSPSAQHPARFSVTKLSAFDANGLLTDLTKQATYRATVRSGVVLSGLTFESGTPQNFAVGDIIADLVMGQFVRDLDDGLAAVEAMFAPLADTASLPTPGVTYRGQIRVVQGAAGQRDLVVFCIKLDDDTFSWKPVLL